MLVSLRFIDNYRLIVKLISYFRLQQQIMSLHFPMTEFVSGSILCKSFCLTGMCVLPDKYWNRRYDGRAKRRGCAVDRVKT